jgi:ubiquitin-activating enzyme E1 C
MNEVSNLNRKLLFCSKDVGRAKADVAAEFIQNRRPRISVTPYVGKIQNKDDEYYKQFNVIIAGLDSIKARNWVSSQLRKIVRETRGEFVFPHIDGGIEAWKGHVKGSTRAKPPA